ncbi:MAG: hypothetical protein NT153_07290 [Bacteroidetes bacterium]|nr:hypothetical protein [Bacteroidota bacterium]
MSQKALPPIEITEVIYDRMYVQINHPDLRKSLLTYRILNSVNKLIRKGSFVGEYIQLSLVHMPDGNYKIYLSEQEGSEYSFEFLKRSNS